jgi:hypothetical protein
MAEPDFIRGLIRELAPSGRSWECSGLQALVNLAWGLALATLRMAPTNLHPEEGEKFVTNMLPFVPNYSPVSPKFLASACFISRNAIRGGLLPDNVIQNDSQVTCGSDAFTFTKFFLGQRYGRVCTGCDQSQTKDI